MLFKSKLKKIKFCYFLDIYAKFGNGPHNIYFDLHATSNVKFYLQEHLNLIYKQWKLSVTECGQVSRFVSIPDQNYTYVDWPKILLKYLLYILCTAGGGCNRNTIIAIQWFFSVSKCITVWIIFSGQSDYMKIWVIFDASFL